LVSSEYTFGVFWLPIWYLLITHLVFADYAFRTFWLPIWCLLITPLISFEHSVGIFRSLHLYFQITPLASFDYAFGIFWLRLGIFWFPILYLLNIYIVFSYSLFGSYYPFCIFWLPRLVSSDKLFVIFWLTPFYFQTFCVVVIEIADHLLFAYQVINLNYQVMVIWEIWLNSMVFTNLPRTFLGYSWDIICRESSK
jgi:hypothetical protein